MKLTEKLDRLMNEKGITKADLAREADIPYTTITSLYDKGYDKLIRR
ncbi:MAG: helix-turn-helix domain-containing protein [Clostridiaceae bacterium]|nr:helix-turn-helix domain-containing protein [Clostridiaceae bacterium]